jgi:ABC-2 type transport system ATP-binding protein
MLAAPASPRASQDAPLVQVDALTRTYGKTQAIKDISFSIRRGEVLGFLGPNGAGKSTTMQIITGNLAPTNGRVIIADHDIVQAPRDAKAALGYLPEQPPLYREFTVDEFLDYCAALHRVPRHERHAARERAKARCGLTEVGRRLIGNLSKGYQQRVGLAQAIIHLPPVIVLDEPTVGLDPIQIREIRTLIRELGRDHAVILSTHILPEVQATCDRVQIINKGRLVLNESIEDLSRHLRARSLIIGLRNPPGAAELVQIPGVTDVRAQNDGRLRVFHDGERDPAETLVRLAAEKNWGLYEINPERATLEELFVEITGTPEASA